MIYDFFVNNYFKIYTHKKIQLNHSVFYPNSEVASLLEKIDSKTYYLIEGNKVFWKKKQYKFIGNITEINKNDTIDFISKVYKDWCRNFYLVPSEPNKKAVFINEEGSFFEIDPSTDYNTNNTQP